MKTETDLINLIKKVEERQSKIDRQINRSDKTKLFWQGAKSELDYLHLHLCKVLKKHQKKLK